MRGKVLFVIITLLILAFAAYLLRIAFVGDPLEDREQVSNLRLTQDGFDIMANWDEADCKAYDINVNRGGKIMTVPNVRDNSFTISNVTPGEHYSITVNARTKKGNFCWPATESIVADKAEQSITVNLTEYYGFANNDFRLKATAIGDITFRSDNKEVARVDSDGNVKMKQPGEANIIVSASGDDFYAEEERAINVVVYPETLDAVKFVKVETINSLKAVIRWKEIDLASAYSVLKRNPSTDEYEKIAELPAETTYYEVTREDFDYVIKGMAEVAGRNIDGRPSEPVEVRGTTQDAPAYTAVKVTKTFNDENMDLVKVIKGPEDAQKPQGICATEDRYIVTYVNKAGSKGYLASYKKDGSFDKFVNADGIGHGNGITYNPYTKQLYVPDMQVKEHSKRLRVYDSGTLGFLRVAEAPKAVSCVSFDVTNNKYYLGKGGAIYVADANLKHEKTIKKSVRWFASQDVGAYNGVIIVGTWLGEMESYLDLYRISDGAYLGSYYVPVGEIESCIIDDGHLVMLINEYGPEDRIYRSKDPVVIP